MFVITFAEEEEEEVSSPPCVVLFVCLTVSRMMEGQRGRTSSFWGQMCETDCESAVRRFQDVLIVSCEQFLLGGGTSSFLGMSLPAVLRSPSRPHHRLAFSIIAA